ncbi:MAG: cation diffusion facilitator family transporter, partial [Planctomycetota bacterium]
MQRPAIDQRARDVRRVLVIEGFCNLALALTELCVGLMTGSWVLVADAMHSATDLANNVVAWFAMRVAGAPADDGPPYGHGEFEILAVFGLATLMGVLALEILLGVLRGGTAEPVTTGPLSLTVACGVMVLQPGLAYWQNRQARRLGSELLHADATHTLADTATTLAAIVGLQIAARGFPWLDRVLAVAVAVFVLVLAF